MNVIRATLNKKSCGGRRGKYKNAPMFHTYFPGVTEEQTSSKSLPSSSDISALQSLGVNRGQVLGVAERNGSSSRSTEPAFRTPCLTTLFKNKSANSDAQITNELLAECLNTPDVPPTTDSSNSKISVRQTELLRSIPPPTSGDGGRKPRSSTSSGNRPRSTPSHSNSRTPRTPRTPKTTSSLESAHNMIIAITEGRGLARGEVGLAAMDTHRPHLILCQISDSQTYTSTLTKINVLHATEILVPNTFIETQEEIKLFSLIREHFPQVAITTVQRRHFSDSVGLQHVQSLCLTECANVEQVVSQKFYALSAAAALLKYIEFQKNMIYMPKSLRIDYQCPENVMAIDIKTAQKLELVMSLNGRGSEGSLLGILDHCCTMGGKRSLRANILQPPTKLDIINSRLLSVTELAQDPALLHSLQSAVSKFCDVEKLLWLCVQVPNFKDEQKASELQTNFVLLLKSTLDSIPVLRESLQPAQTPYFKKVLKDLDNEQFGIILNTILEVVNNDAKTKKGFAASTFQRCFAIKADVNGMLDLARASYSDLVSQIHVKVGEMASEFNLVLRTCSTSNKGFHIQLSIKRNSTFSAKDLPSVFIQVARTRNVITMTTEELVVMNHRIKQLQLEIQIISNIIMQELLRKLRTHISCLYCLCENISELDLLISFAQVSSADNFVPPTFGGKMNVKNSRHPILDFISTSTPVANDVFASPEKSFHIITGPNMGGKSIYIKQVALLQVMAQIGCFIPAESAELRITKQIFSRIGFDDSIEYNASSFVVEMQEMQYILRSMGPKCLIVIDELCRSTDYEEGTAVAWVLCEQLLQSKAFVFFTTHYLTLTKLQSLYPNVTNHQMVAEDGPQGRLVYTHKLRPGVTRVVMYGLKLAQISSLPASVIQRAREICGNLAADRLDEPVCDREKTENEEDQEYIQELLDLIKNNRFNINEVSKVQLKLKKRYGLEDSEENAGRNLAEDSVDEYDQNNGDKIQTNDGLENVPEETRSPAIRNNTTDGSQLVTVHSPLSVRQQSPCITPRNSPLIQNQNQTPRRTPSLNIAANEMHCQMSPNVRDPGCVDGTHTFDSQYRHKKYSYDSLSRRTTNAPNTHTPRLFTEPSAYTTQPNDSSASIVPSTNLRIYSQNPHGTPSPYSPVRTNISLEKSSKNLNYNPVDRVHTQILSPFTNQPCNLFEFKDQYCNSEEKSPSFSNYHSRSHARQPFQSNSHLLTGLSQYRHDERNSNNECRYSKSVLTPSNHTVRSPLPYTSSEHNSQIFSPVLDENSDFQIDRLSSQHRNNWQRRNPLESRPRSHMSEDLFQSPRPSPYPRAFSTPGRLSRESQHQSTLSSRPNTPMVLSLYPSFDVVPQNLNRGNVGLSEDGSFEE